MDHYKNCAYICRHINIGIMYYLILLLHQPHNCILSGLCAEHIRKHNNINSQHRNQTFFNLWLE